MHHQTYDELDWLAFCYVAGELSAKDAETFEARLADDQPAREAVAHAVGIAYTLAAAAREVREQEATADLRGTRRHASSIFGRWVWATVAAAACLAGLWAYRSWWLPVRLSGVSQEVAHKEVPTSSAGTPQQLAVLWNHVREAWTDSSLEKSWPEMVDVVEPYEELSPLPAEDLLAANSPPTWMLAAVRADGDIIGTAGFADPQEN